MATRRNFLNLAAGSLVYASFAPALSKLAHAAPPKVDEFIKYDALGLAKLVKAKEVSPEELLDVVISRIDTLNPILNFMATPTFDRAQSTSAKIPLESLFSGVPTLAKDMIDIGGVRRTDGSRLLATNVPQNSVHYVRALEASGLNIAGTTVVPEFANGLDSELYGSPRNPWNLDYSCMASSSGSACAVADGIVPLAHGTDGGGSNRIPTSACNLFGLKPSRSRMLSGEASGKHDEFKTNGPISRTVRDAAALVFACQDPNSGYAPMNLITGPTAKRRKIAYMRPSSDEGVFRKTVIEAQDNVAKLLRDLGHEVVKIDLLMDLEEMAQMFRWVFLPKYSPVLEVAMKISGQSALETGLLANWTATVMSEGQSYTSEQIELGTKYFQKLAQRYDHVFENYDAIFSATSPIETFEISTIRHSDDFAFKAHLFDPIVALTFMANYRGDCAVSLPLSFSSETDMPIGSMLHAKPGGDEILLELSFELEEARPWKGQWAPYSAKYIPA